MTSSSYATSTSLRMRTALLVFPQRLIPKTTTVARVRLNHTPKFVSCQLSTCTSLDGPSAHEKENTLKLPTRYKNNCTLTLAPPPQQREYYFLASGNVLWNRHNMDGHDKSLPIILRNDGLMQSGVYVKNTEQRNCGQVSEKGSDLLCSHLDRHHQHRVSDSSSKIPPTLYSSVRNRSTRISGSSSQNTRISDMKVGCSVVTSKNGESSWQALYRRRNNSGSVMIALPARQESLTLTRIFHAVYNYQCQRDYLTKKNLFGKRAMSLSLLLDPIIGSPPSALSSPSSVEARDDISALSEGFTRKVKLHRRRLSTSFDEPSHCEHSDVAAGTTSVPLEHVGPFGFRSKPIDIFKKVTATTYENDCEEKKAKLNAWLEQLHSDAVTKADSKSGENHFFGGDSRGSGHGSAHDDDGYSSSKSASPSFKTSEDLFQLLEKVIGCKGRNISHITVEQSVKHLCTVYMDTSDEDKLKFFTILAEKYGVDHDSVSAAATSLVSCKDNDVRLTMEEKLRGALVPKSQWFFTQIGRLENGVKFLVDLRVDLLDSIETSKGKSSLKALNNSLRDLIGMWFNVGFLNLERVTRQLSCDMLQKISEYEAVHPMRNWTDLKKRVGPNRRCFVFTHNSMPGEPVVVLHTFLTDHIASSVQKIVSNHRMRMMSLDSDLPLTTTTEDPDAINTAVFYSITSTQRGLTGIELGNYLIKRVVRELQSEFPKMTQFSTLSPIPGYKNWLVSSIKTAMKDPNKEKLLFTDSEISALKPIFETYDKEKKFCEVFLDVLKLNSWFSDDRLVKIFEKPLMRLCAQYLYLVKRRGFALDPVANFHLKNGAVIWRMNWLGDESPRGLGQSCGIMVNYRYFLETCESNSQSYMENQLIQISDQVGHFVKLTGSSHL